MGGAIDLYALKIIVCSQLKAQLIKAHPAAGPPEPSAATQPAVAACEQPGQQVSISDFTWGRTIGVGAYGSVYIAQHTASGDIVVIKAISKAHCIQQHNVGHVHNEKAILKRLDPHPFIVKFKGAFQDPACLYLVTEWCCGGCLFSQLRDYPERTGSRLTETSARFYAANIVLALEHLQSKGNIAHRDLKPENILLGHDGYLLLTDFGFAKALGCKGVTRSMCGTPDYVAPEVILAQGHGVAVDWWALGCIIYEILSGFPPFYSWGDIHKTYARITLHARGAPLHYPPEWTPMVRDLVTGLLNPDPAQRLGVAGGIRAIKAHPWFQNLDWSLVLKKRYQAPIMPRAARSPASLSSSTASGCSSDSRTSASMQLLEELASGCDAGRAFRPLQHPFTLSPEQQALFNNF